LKGGEIPVDTISKNFLKSLDAPAFSLPRHNLSRQVPSDLPANPLGAPPRLGLAQRRGSSSPPTPFQLLPNRSCSPTCWFLHHRSRSCLESTSEPFFSYPEGRFLQARGQQLLRSLHKGGTRSASGNRLPGSTSDFVCSSSETSARGGGALWRLPSPLVRGQSSTATVLRIPAPFYTVYNPCI
jgi:hypothetical protein